LSSLHFGRYIWKSVKRKGFRNAATIATFAVVTASILFANFLVGGASNSAQAGMSRMGADLMVVPKQYQTAADAFILTGHPCSFFLNESILNIVADIPGVDKAAPHTYIVTLNAGCCTIPTQLIAINSTMDFTIQPWLAEQLGRPLEKDEVIAGHQVLGAAVGTNFIFYGHPFTVAGVLEATGTGVDQSVFLQDSDAMEMAKDSLHMAVQPLTLQADMISSVLVRLEHGADADAVASEISKQVPGTLVINSNYLARKINDQISGTVGSLYLTAGAITIVSIPLVATISSMVANERKREIGLLRAMGAKKGFVFSAILMEALILAALGAVLGAVFAGLMIGLFQGLITTSLGIPFLWPSLDALAISVATVASMTVLIGAIAALYPAISSSRMEPYEAIRKGQN
jgi:putative ABC transport system permease protein